VLPQSKLDEVGEHVIRPALRTLASRGTPFIGALYAGLMLTPKGIRVLEFNARFGDPECQVMLLALSSDLLPWLDGAARGKLPSGTLELKAGAALGVVIASEGYPEAPKSGDVITGIAEGEALGTLIFQAGTKESEPGKLVTAGG